MHKWLHKWKQYKYRFVPWLAINLKNRSIRSVTKHGTDTVISEADFNAFLFKFLTALHYSLQHEQPVTPQEKYKRGLDVLKETSGFTVERSPSILPSGGQGVRVTSGTVPIASVTSLYPGLLYEPYEPIFFQSLGNPFIFQCADGVLVDGNDKALSKSLYKSCRGRDSCWPLAACDESWLSSYPTCPLNVGQYVNNHSKKYAANVAYQEFFLPRDFPARLRQYLPNNHYGSSIEVIEGTERFLKIVALVSLKEIACGEELFSSYFTIVT